MCSTEAIASPTNTYKNGAISFGFGANMAWGIALSPANQQTTAIPQRKFVTGEKFWVTDYVVKPDGVVFQFYSDPYNDVRYYGQLKFPFQKNIAPPADEVMKTIEEVITAEADTQEGATLPTTGPDRGTPSVWWNTVQVGGEGLYGSGPLMRGEQIVGRWVWGGGAVGQVEENGKCRGEVAGNAREQSLWLFSTDACGVYGYSDVAIEHAGRTSPEGEITLTSTNPNLKIRAGSGILLRVDQSSVADTRRTS
jgi:hypothetical protein